VKNPLLLISLCTALFAGSAGAQEKPFFPLGVWYEGGVGDARDNVVPNDPSQAGPIYDKSFADIAAHGINVFVIPNSPPDHHKLVLDTAQKHGLKVILELGLDGGPLGHMIRGQRPMEDAAIARTLQKVLAPVKDHPALLRVQLLDEPPDDSFARYGIIADAVRQFSPRTQPFCCLVGGADGEKFLAESKSDVIAFDSYPIHVRTEEGEAKPLNDFAAHALRFTRWAEKHNAGSWAVVQCHAITGNLRFPTPAEVRCMTWSALANGSKGVFWFLYQSEHVGPQTMMDGLVDRDLNPRPLWDEVAKLTKQIGPVTEALARITDPQEINQDDPLLLVRQLTGPHRAKFLIAVNLDVLNARVGKLRYAGETKDVTLEPGGGAMYQLPLPR
jgi:hypothetical protein